MYAIRKHRSDGVVEWFSAIDGETFWQIQKGNVIPPDLKLFSHDEALRLVTKWNKVDPSRMGFDIVSASEGSETGHM